MITIMFQMMDAICVCMSLDGTVLELQAHAPGIQFVVMALYRVKKLAMMVTIYGMMVVMLNAELNLDGLVQVLHQFAKRFVEMDFIWEESLVMMEISLTQMAVHQLVS